MSVEQFVVAADRRADVRITSPALSVDLDGRDFETRDWSLGGFLIRGIPRHFEVGDSLQGQLGPLSSETRAPFRGRVIRVDRMSDSVAIRFDELGDDAFDLLMRMRH
jgi:hypothetical protein